MGSELSLPLLTVTGGNGSTTPGAGLSLARFLSSAIPGAWVIQNLLLNLNLLTPLFHPLGSLPRNTLPPPASKEVSWARNAPGWGWRGRWIRSGPGAGPWKAGGHPELGTLRPLRVKEGGSARTDPGGLAPSPRALTACVHSPTALRTGRAFQKAQETEGSLETEASPTKSLSLQGLPRPSFSEIQEEAQWSLGSLK